MQHARKPRVLVPMHKSPVLLLAALLASCAAPPVASPSSSSTAPDASRSGTPSTDGAALHGQLAYVAGLDPQIHVLDLGTGESRQLTELRPEHAELTSSGPMRPARSCGFGPWSLSWSPDGEHLAFAYGSCDSVVYIVDLDGNLRRIGDGRGPAWSPDGTRLLHAANVPYSPCGRPCEGEVPPEPGAWDLRVIDLADDGESRPLTEDGSTAGGGSPVWSPDGSTIAYTGPPAAGAPEGVFAATYLVDAGGGQPRFVANGIWPQGWLSDGRLLVTSEGDSSVIAIDLGTGDSSLVGPAQTSSVSPDASLLVAWVADTVSGETSSQLLEADGDVLADIRGDVVAWAPDSRALAALDRPTSSMLILGRDGSLLASYRIELDGDGGPGSWRPDS